MGGSSSFSTTEQHLKQQQQRQVQQQASIATAIQAANVAACICGSNAMPPFLCAQLLLAH
jgi:hypothetical protein